MNLKPGTYDLSIPQAAALIRQVFCSQPESDEEPEHICDGCFQKFQEGDMEHTENGWYCSGCVLEGKHK